MTKTASCPSGVLVLVNQL